MMRFLAICQLLLLCCLSGKTQPTFAFTYDYSHDGNVAVALALDDSNYAYVVDYAACSQGSLNECVSIRKIRTDDGETIWAKQYDFGTGYSYRGGGKGCIGITPSQEIVVAGDEELLPNNEDRFFLGFWDLNGNLVDTFFYDFLPRIRNSFVRSVLVKNDSTFYIFGGEQLGEYNEPIFLSKVNRKGEELWRRYYGDGQYWLPDPESIDFYQDSLLLMSVTEKNGDGRKGMIIITDLEGLNAQVEILEPEQEYWYPRMYAIPAHDGGIIYKFSRDSQRLLHNNLIIRKLNPELEEEWLYEFPFHVSNNIHFILENDNNQIFGGGGTEKNMEFVSWVFLLSPHGELLWEYHLNYEPTGANRYTSLLTGTILPDDSYLLAGVAREPDSIITQNQNGYILKLDSNGLCHDSTCPTRIVIYSDVSKSDDGRSLREVVVYPNPTVERFTIDGDLVGIDRMSLHDLSGKVAKSWTNMDEIQQRTYDISSLSSGHYMLTFYDSGGRVLGQGRILKQ